MEQIMLNDLLQIDQNSEDFGTGKITFSGHNYLDDWKNKLAAVKAVYCLNNHDEHKVYIGSAYNKQGLMGRWQNYFDTSSGGNVELKKLLAKHNNDANYFLDNFYFSILETFSDSTNDDYIIEREHYWMDVFNSRDENQGYNKN